MPLPNQPMNMNQTLIVTGTPEDQNDNPGTTQPNAPPSWSNPAGISVTPAADGLSASVVSGNTPGVFQIDVTVQPVAFGATFTDSFTVTVNELPATQIVFSFGTPTNN